MIDNSVVEKCMKDIGARIFQRREQMRLKQSELAELAGVSTQFFSCVETGKKNIRVENAIRLSMALGVSTDFLLMGRSNQHDRCKIVELLGSLNEEQLRYAEEILKNFVLACSKTP